MALNTTPTTSGQTIIGNIAGIAWANTDDFLLKAFNAATSTRVQSGLNTIAADANGTPSTGLTFTDGDTTNAAKRLALAVAFSAHLKKKK